MLVVHLHIDRDTTAIVFHADGVVGMDSDDDVIAMPSQGFVDGVVHYLKHQMMQTRAVAGVPNVHAWAFAYRL